MYECSPHKERVSLVCNLQDLTFKARDLFFRCGEEKGHLSCIDLLRGKGYKYRCTMLQRSLTFFFSTLDKIVYKNSHSHC